MLRVALFGESVTLAHIVRPLVVARWLRDAGHAVHFASSQLPPFDEDLHGITREHITSLQQGEFLKRIYYGLPPYTSRELIAAVREDIKLLERIRPDIVLGDFRLSLSTAANLLGIPAISITNSYWSKHSLAPMVGAPDLFAMRILGVRACDWIFRKGYSLIEKRLLAPFNAMRRYFDCVPFSSFREALSHGDFQFFAEVPRFASLKVTSAATCFIGPIQWSPHLDSSVWHSQEMSKQELIYVTLGSSGPARRLLPILLSAFASTERRYLVSLAGAPWRGAVPPNVRCDPFVNADEVMPFCSLCISNGGNPTTFQALSKGVPVLGIPSNLDQLLNMTGVVREGVGIMLRGCQATAARIRDAIGEIYNNRSYCVQARSVATEIMEWNGRERLLEFVGDIGNRHRGQYIPYEYANVCN